jgi:hypothetical protein
VVVLPGGRILYWDGLHNEETIQSSATLEIGDRARNDQSRVLILNKRAWRTPKPGDSGINRNGYHYHYVIPNPPDALKDVWNDPGHAPGALFCSDQVILKNGKVFLVGGTGYYSEPHVPGTQYGVAELEGLNNSRVFDPRTNSWHGAPRMHYGRWYPSAVTLGNGNVFVASGVTKLIKPAYRDAPTNSGRNVVQTEIYNLKTRKWKVTGTTGEHSLPLFPRLHLLPDGHVFYDVDGQTFNPFGQAYDEATWGIPAAFDPKTKAWKNLPGVPPLTGFQGSTFDIMLPLRPPYKKASFISGGGVLGPTPGNYMANNLARIDTVDTTGGVDAFTSTPIASLVNNRWYGTGVLSPTGSVFVFSGADRDEVDFPGTGTPIHQAERYNPATGKWEAMASEHDDRTYHNTAVLLPDGRILVGGHSPLPTMYGNNQTLPGASNNWRDPSFEIYSPPYMFYTGKRPVIRHTRRSLPYGERFTVKTTQASKIRRVVLVRNTALTHLVDNDQRLVELKIVSRGADYLRVAGPPNGFVAPPGPYLLFVTKAVGKKGVPSVAKQVFVGAPYPRWLRG